MRGGEAREIVAAAEAIARVHGRPHRTAAGGLPVLSDLAAVTGRRALKPFIFLPE